MAVKTLQTVENALAVLEAVAELQPIGVSALARTMNMDKNTAQRILVTLGARGYIRKFGQGNSWELTPKVLTLSNKVAFNLRKMASTHLQELTTATGETALLWQLCFSGDDITATLLDKVDSTHDVKVTMEIGKTVLVRSSTQVSTNVRTMIKNYPTGAAAWLNENNEYGERFFTLSPGHPSAVAIGSVIYDGPALPIASVAVIGPRERISPDQYAFIGEKTARAAAAISGI